ncbi:ShlB/FhaC/HecB family hemolysin secretion/activation protein [Congregibacter brevis]|uniref:ShlB/FhaC/HecB family hemolysin secretion/activation protein n=1 Tax=Congregibacter brevis TaxID=3081201 RepID=A0ABZ0ICZ6_9GAMM|nr:ShlB/FhaC/HecB family hemolysin secretion/activation protein [Congregibacter sp. IMCC45268]
MNSKSVILLAVLAALTCSASTHAQYPTSGLIYQDTRRERLKPQPRKAAEPVVEQRAQSQPPSGERVDVTHFVVYGNSSLSDAELGNILAPFSHRELFTSQLHDAANTLRTHYRDMGLFAAEVYIPPQAIEDGVVTLHVYEGRLEEGGVELDTGEGDHVNADLVQSILASSLQTGSALHRDDVERAILLADDLPGVTSHSVIYPGQEVGDARFLMRMENTPRVSGNVDIDNFGSYYTGEARMGATLYLNSPTGNGDQLTFRGVTTGSDSNYVFVDYSVPVSGSGLRIGASVDYLEYDLGKQFRAIGSEGEAGSVRLFSSYPFKRSRHSNASGRLEYAYLSLEDDGAQGLLLAERDIHTLTASIAGDSDGDRWPNGTTYYSLGVTAGSVDIQGGEAFKAFDEANVGTDGSFTRVNFQVSRLQHVGGNWSTNVSLSGQWASANLDSSQKFFIGGPFSVPGYPTGEASGDHGANLHTDLRRDFYALPWGGAFQASVFYTAGWAQLFDQTWEGWEGDNPLIKNDIVLQSWGLSATQTWESGLILRGSIGRQLGDNDARNPNTGEATDGSDSDYRAWIQAIYYF